MSQPSPPPIRPRTDYLYELEVWLKGVETFFVLDNLPLSSEQRPQAALRNYASELTTVRTGLAQLASVANEMLGEERRDLAPFLVYLEDHRAGERPEGTHRSTTPEQELAFAIEKIHDLVRIVDEICKSSFIPLQTYRSAGRVVTEILRRDAALAVFSSDDLRTTLDPENKRNLQRIVERKRG